MRKGICCGCSHVMDCQNNPCTSPEMQQPSTAPLGTEHSYHRNVVLTWSRLCMLLFYYKILIQTYLIAPYYLKLFKESKGHKKIQISGISASIILMLTVTELLDVSMELGCSLARVLISSQGHVVTKETLS